MAEFEIGKSLYLFKTSDKSDRTALKLFERAKVHAQRSASLEDDRARLKLALALSGLRR